MPVLKRSDGTRFSAGDKICVLPTIATRFIGKVGTVVGVQMNRRTRTLDKYLVMFDTSEQHMFWDIQLTLGVD